MRATSTEPAKMRAACAEAQLADADWAELRATAAATSFDRHQLNARLKDLGIAKLGHRLMILNQLRALGDEAAAGPLGGASISRCCPPPREPQVP